MIKRALISVSNKTGIVEFAKALADANVAIYSTGGTYKAIEAAGIPVHTVEEITNFPEMMDGRVKTLHPKVHGGILARRDNPAHVAAMKEHGIEGIDLVVVNLYPFRETIAKGNVPLSEAVEQIDIGGPTMVRSAAKNFDHVAIVVNPARYDEVAKQIAETGEVSGDLRFRLAGEAFSHTASYDAAISAFMDEQINGHGHFPDTLVNSYDKVQDLRYGENPHQQAAFYVQTASKEGFAGMEQLQGKELSFNNIVDIEAAWAIINEFSEPAATIIKHTNPCGTAVATNVYDAYVKAYEADPVSAFGGIVAVNREVDKATAEEMHKLFLEVIIAPSYSKEAIEVLSTKKNLRLITLPPFTANPMTIKEVHGGLLVQAEDVEPEVEYKVVTDKAPTEAEWKDLRFAWSVVKHVKSNAIVIAKAETTLGVGAGQMNRVGSAKIALEEAGDNAKGAVMSSDAFFPFGDTVEEAAKHGITAIIQPGGSVRDEESIAAANKAGIAMVFTTVRHFKH